MAQVILNDLIKSMSGKISKDSNYYYQTRRGKTYLCQRRSDSNGYPVVRKTKEMVERQPSSGQIARQQRFAQIMQMVKEVMNTSYLRAQYEDEWKKQKKYSTLRGYIFGQLYAL